MRRTNLSEKSRMAKGIVFNMGIADDNLGLHYPKNWDFQKKKKEKKKKKKEKKRIFPDTIKKMLVFGVIKDEKNDPETLTNFDKLDKIYVRTVLNFQFSRFFCDC